MDEAEELFTEILDCERADLYLNGELLLSPDKTALVCGVLKRRLRGEPLQYILGKTEFMGLEFMVDESVLIPRPETEILVEKTIDIVRSSQFAVQNILDIGTGSGCIAISLAKFIGNINLTASDISAFALEVAKRNASLHNAEVSFFESDLFSNYELRTTNYELIVSNPPYICSAEMDNLAPEISREPAIALDGGEDGLDFYRRIINEAASFLVKDGFLVLEIGFEQCAKVKEIFGICGRFRISEVVKDYNHIGRVLVARKN